MTTQTTATTFASAIQNQSTRTQNGMVARKSTADNCVDLFYKIGASRGKNIIPQFVAALVEDEDIALRIVQWVRDVRGGAGERELFRQVLAYLELHNPELTIKLISKIPEIGRWDDMLVFNQPTTKAAAFSMIKDALRASNGLAAKWMPRQGSVAAELRKFLGMTPKNYRKTLVSLTKVVEQQMCAREWDSINFSQVPSLAHARYKKAFGRNTPMYAKYVSNLVSGKDPLVKVNAGAVFPYDVLNGLINPHYGMTHSKTDLDLIEQQWAALPNYIGDANVLPMVDVSGSMSVAAGSSLSKSTLRCIDVAVSLGLYCADKNTGKFKDMFLTFSSKSELLLLQGNIVQKVNQMVSSNWGMKTNLIGAVTKILDVAVEGAVPQEEMPKILLIMSDMQFDQCARFDDSAIAAIQRQYESAGYKMPQIVFWNINAYGNSPVSSNHANVALVSGFSPSIVKSILAADVDDFTPHGIMMKTVMVPRYDL